MRPLVFDDQPLDALLYGDPETDPVPPTQASLYPDAAPWLAILRANLEAGNKADWQENLLALTRQGIVLPPPDALDCVRRFSAGWHDIPCPKIDGPDFPFEAILQPIFDRAIREGPEDLGREAGDVLVRWYESRHQHREAIDVLQAQFDRALKDGDELEQARCANNLGFEMILAEVYSSAQPHLESAVEGFTRLQARDRANNARANLLTARFQLLGLPEAASLEPEILEVQAFYANYFDPRERKPLLLLARLEEFRGNLDLAISHLEHAIELGAGMTSWLVDEDRKEMERLRG